MTEMRVNLFELVSSLAKSIDMMSPALADHHMRVAYIACRIAEALKLPAQDRSDLVMAASLHDIGGFSLQERMNVLQFETRQPGAHAIAGYLLLKSFRPFERIAEIVRFHHVPWEDGKSAVRNGENVPITNHILHLADRIAVLLTPGQPALAQAELVLEKIGAQRGSRFAPEIVDAFLALGQRDYFWLEALSDAIPLILRHSVGAQAQDLYLDDIVDFARLLCQVIDYKSAFTATHSSGVAEAAVGLGRLLGFSDRECVMLRIAAFLHDLGKLAIPSEILEKPGRLTSDERNIMRTHVYFTYQVLEPIEALDGIVAWASLHQERLDGSGYPFGYGRESLPLGARIMAVADVFTALTEDRPYRKGMTKDEATALLQAMAQKGELEQLVVNMLLAHYDEFDQVRAEAQQNAVQKYQAFQEEVRAGIQEDIAAGN